MTNYYVKTLIGIFTIDKGKIKILLMKKKDNPYKGYWVLPGGFIESGSLEENIKNFMNSIGLPKMYMQQTKTYSSIELDKTENVVATA